MNEKTQQALKELVSCYTQAKTLVLKAEELDPTLRSNVAIVKEFRDCNDHMMRALAELSNPTDKGNEYVLLQIDKSKGHVLRAGYDAIDGIVISSKLKTFEAMKNISNEAISTVCPEYYENVVEFDKISERVAQHRSKKDVGDGTFDNLCEYAEEARKISEISQNIRLKVPHMVRWDQKDRFKIFIEKFILVVFAGITIGVVIHLLWKGK